jgi:hypothetical protein
MKKFKQVYLLTKIKSLSTNSILKGIGLYQEESNGLVNYF